MPKSHEETRGGRTGRRKAFTLRVNDALYEKILESAEQSGRSIAAEAESRIARSLEQDGGRGGPAIAALLDYLGATAQVLQTRDFEGDKADWQRYVALKSAMETAIREFLPAPRTLPGYIDEFNELAKCEPALREAAKSQRKKLGAEEDEVFVPRGIFGGGARAAEAADRQKWIRAVDPYRFRPEPPTNPAENLDAALAPPSENTRNDGFVGLLGDLSAFSAVATWPKAERIETNEQGEPIVRDGALDALMQEQNLRYRENIKISKAEFEWAEARDRITILLAQFVADEKEAETAGRAQFLMARAPYEAEDMQTEYEALGRALTERGLKVSS